MLDDGLIDEIIYLEKRYTREPNCMKTIGIAETLEYLDGKISKPQLMDTITLNTIRLAKRQRTFNNGQFKDIVKTDLKALREYLLISA
jgi:tRNA dimethylallyltransferase